MSGRRFFNYSPIQYGMIGWIIIAALLSVLFAILGFTQIARGFAAIARILFYIFLILFIIALISGLGRGM